MFANKLQQYDQLTNASLIKLRVYDQLVINLQTSALFVVIILRRRSSGLYVVNIKICAS